MIPTAGRIVHYTATQGDADDINKRRAAFERSLREAGPGAHALHVGSHVSEGDAFPAMIVRTLGGDVVNLQVHLDGNDTYWATSRQEGDGRPGTWSWPARTASDGEGAAPAV
jgi:hypothetical protein